MIWFASIRNAWQEFSLLQGRNLFAFIGLLIGTAAVIAIFQIGSISRAAMIQDLEKIGPDTVSIKISWDPEDRRLDLNDFQKLSEGNMGILQIAAGSEKRGTVRLGRESLNIKIIAVTQNFYDFSALELDSGRLTHTFDRFSFYAVIGHGANDLIQEKIGHKLNIGDKFTIQDKEFTVIGTIKKISMFNSAANNMNNAIFIPFLSARRLYSDISPSQIMIRLREGKDREIIATEIKKWIQSKSPKSFVIGGSIGRSIQKLDSLTLIFRLLLTGVGSISLLVSGVGIMNVMMMNVMEKKEEIGLRRAVGATRGAIICFFLCNAFLLCLSGAMGGIVLGTGIGYLFALISGFQFVPSPLAIPLAVGMATSVGFFFGIYPASRAARLDIVTALRSED